jgi:hypothetical protein
MDRKTEFGGPGSSHQDREHPGKNRQPTGRKGRHAAAEAPPSPGAPTSGTQSRVSGGGGERDSHHTHTDKRS